MNLEPIIEHVNNLPRIEVSMHFTGGDGQYDGYYFAEYFTCDIHQAFASAEEAEEELKHAYLGPDCHGVGVEWIVTDNLSNP